MNSIIQHIQKTPIKYLDTREIRLATLLQNVPEEQKEIAVKMFHEGIYFVLENIPQIEFVEEK